MSRIFASALLGLSLLALAGCLRPDAHRGPRPTQPPVAIACAAGETAMQRSTLYFGAAVPGSTDTVDAVEWQRFLDSSVTPRFPDGLTWLDARGQWRGKDGRVIGEPSRRADPRRGCRVGPQIDVNAQRRASSAGRSFAPNVTSSRAFAQETVDAAALDRYVDRSAGEAPASANALQVACIAASL